MSCFNAVLKCIFCEDDDDDRSSRQSYNALLTRQSNSGVTNNNYSTGVYRSSILNDPRTRQSNSSTGVYRDPLPYTIALDRDPQPYSSGNAPPTSQSNSGVATYSSFKTRNDSYSSQQKSTYDRSRATTIVQNSAPVQLSRDAVSGTDTFKLPSIPNSENIAKSLSSVGPSHNATVNSIKSISPKPPPSFQPPKPAISVTSSSPSSPQSKEACVWVDYASSTNEVSNSHSALSSKPTNSKSDQRKNDCIWAEKAGPSSSTNEAGKALSVGKTKVESPKPPPISAKPTISLAPSSYSSAEGKHAYIWVEKDASSAYVFPKEIKSLIEKDIVPGVLKMPLSKSSYKDYFHALICAEDCYYEKWDGFEMKNVKVQLHQATIYTRRGKNSNLKNGEDKDEKFFVAFELDKIRERRPFLISRDFVSLRPTKQTIKPFQGVIYRVVKSNLVLAEFKEEFFSRHHPDNEYDVKFSFNRVCLKRAHQAVAAASEFLFGKLIFPDTPPKHELSSSPRYIYQKEPLAVAQILTLQGLPPCLVEGPLAAVYDELSKTGMVVVEAIIQILRADPSKRILLCAPMNRTCDVLMRGLKKEIAESEMFRANAAFREDVPEDILPSCLYTNMGDTECFICPEFAKLREYRVISTTFMSSYRLYGEGINGGYFSHIFMVDASSATEPEAMVPLANFVTAKTVVVVTGAPGNHSSWIRSKIARENGLVTSYFERLRDSTVYRGLDAKLMVQLEDREKGMYQTRGSPPRMPGGRAFML